ncbi:uncharacterized protein [Diabrotica undecimpunctata]|uniref:uncharacterized protein n=1 Tax=Diabrotica undecimpunctata TaxID=50387 RepID=UPI003B633276
MNSSKLRTTKSLKPYVRWLQSSTKKTQKMPRHGQSCEIDCCGNPLPKEKDVVVEKNLDPCIFDTWKPKIPVLKAEPKPCICPPVTCKPKFCYAGMKCKPGPAELKEKGIKCLGQISPKAIPVSHPPAMSIQKCLVCPQVKRKPSQPKLPFPDWDHDCDTYYN